jgi:hypothetical protein
LVRNSEGEVQGGRGRGRGECRAGPKEEFGSRFQSNDSQDFHHPAKSPSPESAAGHANHNLPHAGIVEQAEWIANVFKAEEKTMGEENVESKLSSKSDDGEAQDASSGAGESNTENDANEQHNANEENDVVNGEGDVKDEVDENDEHGEDEYRGRERSKERDEFHGRGGSQGRSSSRRQYDSQGKCEPEGKEREQPQNEVKNIRQELNQVQTFQTGFLDLYHLTRKTLERKALSQ